MCLTNNNSTFPGQNLMQTNGAAMGAVNPCYYSVLEIQPIFYFGWYSVDCIAIWIGDVDKVNLLLEVLNF